MFVNDKGPMGGILAMPDDAKAAGAPQHWLAYISTPDVDKTVARASERGAQVCVPSTDLDVGRFAVLADPQGAGFAVYAPKQPGEDTAFAPAVGDASWHELLTTDYESALGFYGDLFGWEKTGSMDMGEAGTYQMYGRRGDTLGGMFNKNPDMPGSPHWLVYFKVGDVAERIGRITTLGGQILNGPLEVPGGDLIAQCLDPQGGVFAIHSAKVD
jgi:predicted enzyme related to lactoylglutathione lyase